MTAGAGATIDVAHDRPPPPPHRRLFVLRDDDTNYFTTPERLERAYADLWDRVPVTLAVVPFHASTRSKAIPAEHWDGAREFPLHENGELVSYLRQQRAAGRVAIAVGPSALDAPFADLLPSVPFRRKKICALHVTGPVTDEDPLIYLQSLEDPGLCFITMPILAVDPRYRLRVSGEDLDKLGLTRERQPGMFTQSRLCYTASRSGCDLPSRSPGRRPPVVDAQIESFLQFLAVERRAFECRRHFSNLGQ